MKGLMHACRNWGDIDCHSNVRELKYAKKIGESEKVSTSPIGKELEGLNEICKQCEYRFFIVNEKKCPACKILDIEETDESHKIQGKDWHFGFKCNDCGTKFWISETDLKS